MILELVGNDYKYAAEQMMLTMYPGERPVYGKAGMGELSVRITLRRGGVYTTVTAVLYDGAGGKYTASSRADNESLSGELERNRILQRCVKMAFYKAAKEATGKSPDWGALTGIRPAKLVTGYIEEGMSVRGAVNRLKREFFVSAERAQLCGDAAVMGLRTKNSLEERDVALYIGIPFCPTRCAYCSFVSNSVEKSIKLIEPFLESLNREIAALAKVVEELGLNVISVYMGGGTPTTLSAGQLDGLIGKLSGSFSLKNVREFTVEAGRPDTITREKLQVLKNWGIDRISINPQSMRDEVLAAIGRRHTSEAVAEAVELARSAGMGHINMDLIAGLPADSAEGFRYTVDRVLALSPESITIHTLSLKKGTKITLENTKIPGGDEVRDMLDYGGRALRMAGYGPYYLYRQKYTSGGFENVGWSKKGYESLYNILIMEELCSILSMGGGGSTKLVAAKQGKIQRIFNPKYPYEYIEGIEKVIKGKEGIREFYETEVF
jgi:oxygen-independent coproporphyrinogen-3 oxidase